VAAIVAGSDVLVTTSVDLGGRLGVPAGVIGTIVLAVATSLPNTWAAISLVRRGLGAAVLPTALNSNSINLAVGAGLPALVLSLPASAAAMTLDAPWLLGMSVLAAALMLRGRELTRPEGTVLVGLYGTFVLLRLILFG
jgi:cation:H+ antiporter